MLNKPGLAQPPPFAPPYPTYKVFARNACLCFSLGVPTSHVISFLFPRLVPSRAIGHHHLPTGEFNIFNSEFLKGGTPLFRTVPLIPLGDFHSGSFLPRHMSGNIQNPCRCSGGNQWNESKSITPLQPIFLPYFSFKFSRFSVIGKGISFYNFFRRIQSFLPFPD